MKRNNLILFFLLLVFIVNAQSYEPTTKWPYLYENFKSGILLFSDNTKTTASVNVHLLGSLLHYEKDGLIYHVDINKLEGVDIGEDKFVPSNGKLVKIVGKLGQNYMAKLTIGDFDALMSSSGAYGMSSSSSSVNKLSSIEIGGISNLNYRLMVDEKQEGRILPLKTEYLLIIKGKSISAVKSEIEKTLTDDKKVEFKAFIKDNKIKFNKEESLSNLLKFFEK